MSDYAFIKSNNPAASYFDFFSKSGTDAVNSSGGSEDSPITATGGIISNYEVSGTHYRAHTFTLIRSFVVTSGEDNIEYLVVAGGGGGGLLGGGGGAGGFRTNTDVIVMEQLIKLQLVLVELDQDQ